ncbi:hypothetical protein GO495_19095 [Chitinophaga oryziterrae]|jgi:hypothetical protein|uniref:Uncharacterized protein n=1 Tax=Chitinophaga oryziterrae TaxID=1031224 RepID=A0A6N8JED9_9BACT|nr:MULTISPECIES: hypothetical protein [Chitinophaga]MVT42708.1 hypothetical protein [Chitinophaga oryziterrae]SEW08325.1 hypothetical protein SAMN05428988_1885 [Chitinophaga sp. YR573]
MQDEFAQQWKRLEDMLTERFGKKPNMEAILFLIGIQELAHAKTKFTKEQKQDLMHVATCTLLSQSGYYEPEGFDPDGWPHFKEVQPVPKMGMMEQERFLKEHIIAYFDDLEGL